MCAIVGALIHRIDTELKAAKADRILGHILNESRARGRDGFGFRGLYKNEEFCYAREGFDITRHETGGIEFPHLYKYGQSLVVVNAVFNFRAEPTTEFVPNKQYSDQQPYTCKDWTIVHNGTIANDKELRTGELATSIDSAAIAESLSLQSPLFDNQDQSYIAFRETIKRLVGSYAILAQHDRHPNQMLVAANYRPVWYAINELGVFFASSKDYFPKELTPVALTPYSTAHFAYESGELVVRIDTLRVRKAGATKTLVIASGGLDSTVAASQLVAEGHEVSLLHFLYGCRSERQEVFAINAIGEKMGINVIEFPLNIYDPSDSRLFDKDSEIAGGEEGAEFAHEWVPARNLVMLSVATAYAEANNFEYIALGNNLEEAGAYPDNEPDFIRRFNELLPFAVGDGKRVEVLMPVGDLMKHEIVKLGLKNNAPLELTWSCYKNGEYHCGKCGPCFMRKTAFHINHTFDPIVYEN